MKGLVHVTDEVGEELDGITEEGLRAAVFLELGGKVANGAGDAKVVHAVTGIDVAAFPSQGIMKGVHKVQRVTPGVRRVYKRIRMKEENKPKRESHLHLTSSAQVQISARVWLLVRRRTLAHALSER